MPYAFRAAAFVATLFGTWASSASADPGQLGSWSPLQQYPFAPISAALTPDGTIVAWDQADAGAPYEWGENNGRAFILDPNTGSVLGRSANLAPASVFCPVITTLPDGKVMIAGGGGAGPDSYNPIDVVQTYDPASRTFGASSKLSAARWYPGGGITKEGDLVTLGGTSGTGVDVVSATTGKTRRVSVAFGGDWYPAMLRMPDGRFVIENVTDVQSGGPATREILDLTGNGSLTTAPSLSELQRRYRMAMTRVGPHTMLGITGSWVKESYLLDTSSGSLVVTRSGNTRDPHVTAAAVTLPDGSALTIGGTVDDESTSILSTERWSPTTGQWTQMAPTPRQRRYHSVATLLPDGRVWSAGTSTFIEPRPAARDDDLVVERNGAVFTPPYLYKQDGSGELARRPQITDAPARTSWGATLKLWSPQGASISRAALVRVSATTHQYDFGGTYVPLPVQVTGHRVTAKIPSNGNTVPAGYYMVFLVDNAGVPSEAAIVRIDPSRHATPSASTMMSSAYHVGPTQRVTEQPAWMGADGDDTTYFRTMEEHQPWWQIDYGVSRDHDKLVLHNRDVDPQRLANAWVFASDQPLMSTDVTATRLQPGVTAVQVSSTPGATVEIPLGRRARYVRVQLPGTGTLHLAEVETVAATPTAEPSPAPQPAPRQDPEPSPPPVPVGAAANQPAAGTKAGPSVVQSRLRARIIARSRTTTVRVTNRGTAAETITALRLRGRGWKMNPRAKAPRTLKPGQSLSLILTRGRGRGALTITTRTGALVMVGPAELLPRR